jgi:hypothetical protein
MEAFMKALLIVMAVMVCCCAKPVKTEVADDTMKRLEAKHARYLELSLSHSNDHGWLRDTECDGLLFNSLWNIARLASGH